MLQAASTSPTGAAIPDGGRWRLFFGLSRTPHGLLDMATPAMAALLGLGRFPESGVMLLGLATAFAGYTAVYALNDLIDYRADQEKIAVQTGAPARHFDMDGILVPHPVAQRLLPLRSGILWFSFWAGLALAGAWWLNPVCAILFLAVAVLEILYCKLLKVTHLKIVPTAIVKASGGLVGIYAVDPNPSAGFVAVLLLWLASWEIGGQNVANDILDMEEDARISARTVATVLGIRESVFIIVAATSMAAVAGVAIYWLSGPRVGWIYPLGAAALGWKLLLGPARSLYHNPGSRTAASLFNQASYLPLAFLVLTVLSILVPF